MKDATKNPNKPKINIQKIVGLFKDCNGKNWIINNLNNWSVL